jgi:hypothetical protein
MFIISNKNISIVISVTDRLRKAEFCIGMYILHIHKVQKFCKRKLSVGEPARASNHLCLYRLCCV